MDDTTNESTHDGREDWTPPDVPVGDAASQPNIEASPDLVDDSPIESRDASDEVDAEVERSTTETTPDYLRT